MLVLKKSWSDETTGLHPGQLVAGRGPEAFASAVHMRYVVPVSLSTLIKMCVTGSSARFSHNTDGLAPDDVQGKCWPECPRLCSASAENPRKVEMRSCSQARLSDDGLVSLVARKPSHGSNVTPDAPCGPSKAAQVTANYFSILTPTKPPWSRLNFCHQTINVMGHSNGMPQNRCAPFSSVPLGWWSVLTTW